MSLESAIAAQTGERQPDEVTELVLDTCKANKVSGLDKYSNLRLLTLNGCGLTTLEGFPTLPKLLRLELSDNNLCDGLEALQEAGLVQLRFLSLAGNKFTALDQLEPLAALPNLRDLDMFTCAVTDLPDYRKQLFQMFPVLKYLDGFDADDNEKPEEDGDDDGEDEDEEDDDVDEDEDDDLLDSELDPSEGGDDDEGLEGDDTFGEEDEDEDEVGEAEDDEAENDESDEDADGALGGDAKRQRR